MAKQTSLFLTQTIINQGQTFNVGDSGVYKTIFTAGNDDSLIKSINVYYNATGAGTPPTSPVTMQFAISGANRNEPTLIHPFYVAPIFGGAGSGVNPPIDIISATGMPSLPIDSAGKRYYPIESGAQIVGRFINNLIGLGQITVTTIAENY